MSELPRTFAGHIGTEPSTGIGVSLILVAAGAILTWAVDATVSGLNIHTGGVILMVVGVIGLVLSMICWSSWGAFGNAPPGPRTTVIEDRNDPRLALAGRTHLIVRRTSKKEVGSGWGSCGSWSS